VSIPPAQNDTPDSSPDPDEHRKPQVMTQDMIAQEMASRPPAKAAPPGGAAGPPTGFNELRLAPRSLLSLFVFALLLAGLYLAYQLLSPFLDALIIAVVFSAIFHPAYQRCLRLTRGRKTLAAAAMVLVFVLLVAAPLTLFVIGLVPQMRASGAAFIMWMGGAHLDEIFTEYLSDVFAWLQENAPFLDVTAIQVKESLMNASRRFGQTLLGFSTGFVGVTLNVAVNFVLFLLFFFFFTRDGAAMVSRIKYLTPLREEQQERIISTLRRISRAVLVGGFIVAAAQGVAGGIGLAFVGIPALFWGTVMACASLVPVLGTGLVWVPACVYLLLSNEWKSAIFLALWCGIGVTSIDTFLRPLLMREASGIPVLFLFLSILGGIHAFGVLGLLYGPLILTFAVVMLAIYGEEYEDHLENNKRRR
jgi:predicted PurR-regulated permease PerM